MVCRYINEIAICLTTCEVPLFPGGHWVNRYGEIITDHVVMFNLLVWGF